MAVKTAAGTGLMRFRPAGPGSRIGLVAPASSFSRTDFEAGLKELERIGFIPVYDERVFDRDVIVAGSAESRAKSLRAFWARPDIDVVLAVRGGYGSAEILPLLDAGDALAARTAFVGYSDTTAIHTYLNCHAGLTSVHGPMIDGRLALGESAYERSSFHSCLSRQPLGEISAAGLSVVCSGEATGPLYGGTLTQLTSSLGTPYHFDPPAGHILLIDEVGERPYRLRRMLTQLAQSGILARAAGVIIGQLPRCDEPSSDLTGLSVVGAFFSAFPGPIVAGFPTGHTTTPLLSVPLGVPVRVVGRAQPALVFDAAAAA